MKAREGVKGLLLFVLSLQAAFFCPVGSAAALPPMLKSSLSGFALTASSLDGGVLRLVVDRPVVNQELYRTVVRQGVCMPLWSDARKGWSDSKIDRLEVVNRTQVQGFALVDARPSCVALGKLSSNAEDQFFAARTWVCLAGAPCRKRRPDEHTSGDD